jgi:hypothetical protein
MGPSEELFTVAKTIQFSKECNQDDKGRPESHRIIRFISNSHRDPLRCVDAELPGFLRFSEASINIPPTPVTLSEPPQSHAFAAISEFPERANRGLHIGQYMIL